MTAVVFFERSPVTLESLPPEIACIVARTLRGRDALMFFYALRTSAAARRGGAASVYANVTSDYVWRHHLDRDFPPSEHSAARSREHAEQQQRQLQLPCIVQYMNRARHALGLLVVWDFRSAFTSYSASLHTVQALYLAGFIDLERLSRLLCWGIRERAAATLPLEEAGRVCSQTEPLCRARCSIKECAVYFNPDHSVASKHTPTGTFALLEEVQARTALLRHGYESNWAEVLQRVGDHVSAYPHALPDSHTFGFSVSGDDFALIERHLLPWLLVPEQRYLLRMFVRGYVNMAFGVNARPVTHYRCKQLIERSSVAAEELIRMFADNTHLHFVPNESALAAIIDSALDSVGHAALFAHTMDPGITTTVAPVAAGSTERYVHLNIANFFKWAHTDPESTMRWTRRLMRGIYEHAGRLPCSPLGYHTSCGLAYDLCSHGDADGQALDAICEYHDEVCPHGVVCIEMARHITHSARDAARFVRHLERRPAMVGDAALQGMHWSAFTWIAEGYAPDPFPANAAADPAAFLQQRAASTVECCRLLLLMLEVGRASGGQSVEAWTQSSIVANLLTYNCRGIDDANIDSDTRCVPAVWKTIAAFLDCYPQLAVQTSACVISRTPFEYLVWAWAPTSVRFAEMARLLIDAVLRLPQAGGFAEASRIVQLLETDVVREAPQLAAELLALLK